MLQYLLSRPIAVVVVCCGLGLVLLSALRGQPQPPPGRPPLTTAAVVVLRSKSNLPPLQRLDTLRLTTIKARTTAKELVNFSWYLAHDVAGYAPMDSFVGSMPPDMARNLLLLALPCGGPHDRAVA